MIFLIQYDRMGGHLLSFKKFLDADRKQAKGGVSNGSIYVKSASGKPASLAFLIISL